MNKLLQTTLITAILSSGVMASDHTGMLLQTIESIVSPIINKDIKIGGMSSVTINNYGAIDT